MKHIGLAAAALSLVAAIGPVGGIIPVLPAQGTEKFRGHATAYSDKTRHYITVATLSDGAAPAIVYSLRSTVIDPRSETATPAITLLERSTTIGDPSLAWNQKRNRGLVVFTLQDANGIAQVQGLVIDSAGKAVGGPTPFVISQEWNPAGKPRVASDGQDWFVTWTGMKHVPDMDDVQVVRARKLAGTTVNDAAAPPADGVEIAQPTDWASSVEIAAVSSSQVLVGWVDGFASGGGSLQTSITEIWARSVSFVDNHLGTARRFSVANDYANGLSIAPGTAGFIVAWGGRVGSVTIGAVLAQRTDFDGAPVGASLILAQPSDPDYVDKASIRLAWNPLVNQYLATWGEKSSFDSASAAFQLYRLKAVRFDANASVVLTPSTQIVNGEISTKGAVLSVASPTWADSKVLVVHRNTSIAASFYDLFGLDTPNEPETTQQSIEGSAEIPQGATIAATGFVAKAVILGPAGVDIRLDVEIAQAGTPFTGTTLQSSAFVPSGTVMALPVSFPGFALGNAYHWRSRTIDTLNRTSHWVSQGSDPEVNAEVDLSIRASNAAPVLSRLEQRRGSDGRAVAGGAKIYVEPSILFLAPSTDADDDRVRIEIELRRAGQSFTGEATQTGAWTAAGTPPAVGVDFPGADAGDAYHWRARVVDTLSASTPWTTFGSDGSAADFEFQARGSLASASCLASSAGVPAAAFVLAAIPAFLFLRKSR